MDLKEIKQIVELMNKNELSYFHLEKDDFRLKLKKGADAEAIAEMMKGVSFAAPTPMQAAPMPAAAAPAPAAPAGAAEAAPAAAEAEGDTFKAPMVGTFYSSPKPDADPFVKIGQEVDENTTLCMIEAMKTFNEIKAECRGTIVKCLVDNAQPVQFDDPLFVIKPS